MATATEVRLLGEGGVEWTFDLPLTEVFADQVKSHKLRPVDDESAAALSHLLVPAEGESEPEVPQPPRELTLAERIDAAGSHDAANALAAELGVEGFEAKKPVLDAKKAALREAAAARAAE